MRVNVNARFSVLLYIRVDRTQDKVEKISKCNESEWKMNVKSTINLYDEFRIDIPEYDRQIASMTFVELSEIIVNYAISISIILWSV